MALPLGVLTYEPVTVPQRAGIRGRFPQVPQETQQEAPQETPRETLQETPQETPLETTQETPQGPANKIPRPRCLGSQLGIFSCISPYNFRRPIWTWPDLAKPAKILRHCKASWHLYLLGHLRDVATLFVSVCKPGKSGYKRLQLA